LTAASGLRSVGVMNLRLSLGLLAGVVIAACGGGDGGETGSDGGATGEPLTEVPFDEFYARAETAFCAWQVACGQYGVEARCASVNHLDLRLSMQRISGVGIADSVPLDYMREAIELGRIGYDEEAAAACLEYVRGRSCEWAQLHALSEAELAGQTACAAVFTGRMGRNGPCISASECAGTAICGFDPACVDACCVGACRVLPEPRKIGEACTGGNPGCEPNSFCDFDPNTGMPTVCKAAPKLGQACAQGLCADGAICDYTGDSAICVKPKAPGKRCYNDNECEQPGVCRYNENVGDSVCFRPSAEGGPCSFDSGGLQCLRFDNYCAANNTCSQKPGKGESCQGSYECKGDFFCGPSQSCTPVADQGEPCGYAPPNFDLVPCSGDNYCSEFEMGTCLAPTGAAACPVPADPVPGA